MPLTLVFSLFFLVPLALVLMVSFWDYNQYELIPGFTFKSYIAIFEGSAEDSQKKQIGKQRRQNSLQIDFHEALNFAFG